MLRFSQHYGDGDDDEYVEELLQDKDELDDLIDDLVYDAASDDDDDDNDDDDADNHSATMSVHISPSEITDLLREHDEAMNNWEDFNDDGMYNFDDSNVDRSDMNYGDDDDSDNSYMSGFSNDHDVQFEPSIFATQNFYGGPGESSHKQFVKAPGLKTQRRVSEFAVQTAKQYHNVMITRHALTCIKARTTDTEIDESTEEGRGNGTLMEGKYEINTSDTSWEENWSHLHDDLLQYYCRNKTTLCRKSGPGGGTTITGYTRGRHIDDDGDHTIFYAHPNYRGSPWYDWAYVHFVERGEEVYYPSKILGFVQLENSVEAVIQCSVRPMNWETLEKKMFVGIELGVKTESFVTVKLSSIVYSLCVIKDYGGGKNKYIVVLSNR